MGGAILMSALGQIPFALVWVVAFVVAVARWDRHVVVSSLVCVAAVIETFLAVARGVMPVTMHERGVASLGILYTALGLLGTVGYVLVVVAVFIDRAKPSGPPSPVIR